MGVQYGGPAGSKAPERAGTGFPDLEELGPGFWGFVHRQERRRYGCACVLNPRSALSRTWPAGDVQNCLDSQAVEPGTKGLQHHLRPTLSARGDVTVPVTESQGSEEQGQGSTLSRRP